MYILKLDTGEKSLLLQNDGFIDFKFDHDLKLRMALKLLKDGSTEVSVAVSGAIFKRCLKIRRYAKVISDI